VRSRPSLIAELRGLPRPLWLLLAGVFLNRFGTFVLPFLVLYLTSRGFSAAQAGLALSAYGLGNLAAALLGGQLADRIDRRSTIAISMTSSAVVMLALSQADHLPVLLVLALCAGLCADLFRPAAAALVVDLCPAEQRLTGQALHRLAAHLGFAAGPVTAGLLVARSFTWLFIADAATSLVFGGIAVTMLPRIARHAAPPGPERRWLATAFADRRFVRFLVAVLAISVVTYQLDATLPLHVVAAGHAASTFGLLASIHGALIVGLEVSLTVVTRRFPERTVMAAGYLMTGVGFALTAVATSTLALGATIALWTCGEMISSPVAGAYLATLAPPHLRGRYMGLVTAAWSLALILGPALGTLVYAVNEAALWAGCGAVGVLAAVLVLL
jgi:MFS family permease